MKNTPLPTETTEARIARYQQIVEKERKEAEPFERAEVKREHKRTLTKKQILADLAERITAWGPVIPQAVRDTDPAMLRDVRVTRAVIEIVKAASADVVAKAAKAQLGEQAAWAGIPLR